MTASAILALDLSSTTGWAFGRVGDEVPRAGVWHLPVHLSWGAAFVALENELDDALEALKPDEVWVEAPLAEAMAATARGTRNASASYQQFGLAALAEACCYRQTILCRSEHVGRVRSVVLGSGRIPKDIVKQRVLAYCHARGWKHITDHNAGDAAVLWQYREGFLRRNSRIRSAA